MEESGTVPEPEQTGRHEIRLPSTWNCRNSLCPGKRKQSKQTYSKGKVVERRCRIVRELIRTWTLSNNASGGRKRKRNGHLAGKCLHKRWMARQTVRLLHGSAIRAEGQHQESPTFINYWVPCSSHGDTGVSRPNWPKPWRESALQLVKRALSGSI